MILEISQIKAYLAKHHGLPLEGTGLNTRVVGEVPDGEHTIPLGYKLTPTRVVIRDGAICIDPKE
jgi:hypothetical protein